MPTMRTHLAATVLASHGTATVLAAINLRIPGDEGPISRQLEVCVYSTVVIDVHAAAARRREGGGG